MKVLLSTFGPLHLIKGANYICRKVHLSIIQGWVPGQYTNLFIRPLSFIVKKDLQKSLKKRECTGAVANNGIALPEFLLWIGKKWSWTKISNLKASKLYGYLSKPYIKDADIFHVRAGNGQGGAIEYARKKGMKIIVDQSLAHNAFIEKALKPDYDKYGLYWGFGPKSPFWKQVMEDCKKADLLLVNSDFVKNTFVSQGFDPQKISVVYLGVRDDFFKIKKNYEISNTIRLLFTGGFGFRKGGLYLLEAMELLNKRNVKYELTIVGSYGDEREILKEYDNEFINYVGFVPQDCLKEYLSESDIYIFPSLAEGCASSGMEAMCAGMPVIATYESGLPITNKYNGLIIPSKNPEAIANAIFELITDRELRENCGKHAAELIHSNYTWDKYAEGVLKCYNKVLN